jgi:hypothetical protein
VRRRHRPAAGQLSLAFVAFLACCLCQSWPAPVENWVGGRIMLVCRSCAGKPSTPARLAEIRAVEWD